MLETGTVVRFKDRGLPKREIDPPTTPLGDLVSWQEYFGGTEGVVIASDAVNGFVTVRGRDTDGNPYTVEIEPKHLDTIREV